MQRRKCTIYNGTLGNYMRYLCFCLFKLFIFICCLSEQVTCAFLADRNNEEIHRINPFPSQKNNSKFLIRFRFEGYRCKSDTLIFALRVVLNYAYSPFLSFFKF